MPCRLRNHALCCCALETQLVPGMVFPHPHRSSDVCSDSFKLDSQDPECFVGDSCDDAHSAWGRWQQADDPWLWCVPGDVLPP